MLERDHYTLNDGTCVPFVVRVHGRARRLRLKVVAPGRIELVLPHNCPLRQASAFLQQQHDWLQRELTTLLAHSSERPDLLELPAVGEQWRLEFKRAAQRSGVRIQHTTLHVGYRDDDWQSPLRRWLARRAEAHLGPRLTALSRTTGIDYARLTIRGQRSRWGSCSARGNISLNYKALLLEPELVDYLLVHELCHRVHLNHSPDYWALVAHYLPDHRERRRALRHAESNLPPWLMLE